jgi:2-methylcitrate dehydratase PrpD
VGRDVPIAERDRDGAAVEAKARKLAAFAAELRFDDLPVDAVAAARRHLLDTLGVAIRGQRSESAQSALRGIAALDGSAGTARVWGSRETLAAPYAALANGVAAHALDYDDTHTDAIVHGSAILAPVVIALGETLERPATEAIAAFVAGWEVAARVGLASRGTFHRRGFHTTSIAGVFGAAAAASRLCGSSVPATLHALGLAGSQASGISEYLSNGSSAKSLHTGWSAYAGIVAARLAQAGMTGPETVFEGRYGVMRTHGVAEDADVDALDAELGTRWEVTRISVKPYPCCHFAHAFIDCVLALAKRGVTAASVARLHCVVPETELPLICEPVERKQWPASPYAAKFSLPYLLAAALVDRRIDHRTFAEENLRRDDLRAVAMRVTHRAALPGETGFPRYFPGWVEATLADGQTLVEKLPVNRGHPENPLDDARIADKFRDNAADALGRSGCERVLALVADAPSAATRDLARALASF